MRTYSDMLREQKGSVNSSGASDEYTGDPRIRDLWEKTRHERHVLIRSMWGDPWGEASWPTRIGRVLSHAFLWVIGVPFVWAAILMLVFFATAVVMTMFGMD